MNPQSHLWVRFAIALRVGYFGLLRPSVLCGLLRGRVSLPADTLSLQTPDEPVRAVLVIFSPKNWRHASRHQTVVVDDPDTVGWLTWLISDLDDLATIFPSIGQMRRLLAHSLDCMQLHGLHLGLASLRAGGATALFQK